MASVSEIITQHTAMHANTVSDNVKIMWLRKLEQMIINDVILTHENGKLIAPGRGDKIAFDDMDRAFRDAMNGTGEDMLKDGESRSADLVFEAMNRAAVQVIGGNVPPDDHHRVDEYQSTNADWLRYHIEHFGHDTELIVQEPYDDLYIYYIDLMIARGSGDAKLRNASAESFNQTYMAYQQYYNRTHMPVHHRTHLISHRYL